MCLSLVCNMCDVRCGLLSLLLGVTDRLCSVIPASLLHEVNLNK